jgi:hypothetical protein
MKIILKGVLILVILGLIGVFFGPDDKLYEGEAIDNEWDAKLICTAAATILKGRNGINLKKVPCVVSELKKPLPGVFSTFKPYMVQWENGYAARVFATPEGLKMSGFTENSPPPPNSW